MKQSRWLAVLTCFISLLGNGVVHAQVTERETRWLVEFAGDTQGMGDLVFHWKGKYTIAIKKDGSFQVTGKYGLKDKPTQFKGDPIELKGGDNVDLAIIGTRDKDILHVQEKVPVIPFELTIKFADMGAPALTKFYSLPGSTHKFDIQMKDGATYEWTGPSGNRSSTHYIMRSETIVLKDLAKQIVLDHKDALPKKGTDSAIQKAIAAMVAAPVLDTAAWNASNGASSDCRDAMGCASYVAAGSTKSLADGQVIVELNDKLWNHEEVTADVRLKTLIEETIHGIDFLTGNVTNEHDLIDGFNGKFAKIPAGSN